MPILQQAMRSRLWVLVPFARTDFLFRSKSDAFRRNATLISIPVPCSKAQSFAGLFGLVHVAGFANYLRDLFVDRIALPLFGVNIGIELRQIVVLVIAGVLLAAADWLIATARRRASAASVQRMRIVAVSAIVMVVSAWWAVERSPW